MPFIETALPDTEAWIRHFVRAELPVLARTTKALAVLHEKIDDVAPRDISTVVEDDPLMSLKVLAWAGRRLERNMRLARSTLDNEIDSVEAAIISAGITPFFQQFGKLETVEARLAEAPQARLGLLRVLGRSLAAAHFARDWAGYRNDLNIKMISEAAMLHDVAEILVWVYAPTLSLRIQTVQQAYPAARSQDIQKSILGITFNELEVAIMTEWRLSSLLKRLTNDAHADMPQVRNVVLAANLARHLANSPDDPALTDDVAEIAELLRMSPQWVRARIFPVAQERLSTMPPT